MVLTQKPNDPPKQAPSSSKSSATDTLLLILRELQSIDAEFPIQYAVCLLEISQNQGRSLTALSDKTGMPLSTISRIVGALSQHRQKGKPFELLEVKTSETERRRKEVYLSAKGKAIVERLGLILEG